MSGDLEPTITFESQFEATSPWQKFKDLQAKGRTAVALGFLGGAVANFLVPFMFQIGFGADPMPAFKRSIISSSVFTVINGTGVVTSWLATGASAEYAPLVVDLVTPALSGGAYSLIQYMGDFGSQGALKDFTFATGTNLASIGVRPAIRNAVNLTTAWVETMAK